MNIEIKSGPFYSRDRSPETGQMVYQAGVRVLVMTQSSIVAASGSVATLAEVFGRGASLVEAHAKMMLALQAVVDSKDNEAADENIAAIDNPPGQESSTPDLSVLPCPPKLVN